MKYIKTFENQENQTYNVGDYVLLKKKTVYRYNNMIENKCLIYHIDKISKFIKIKTYNQRVNKLITLFIKEKDIKRKLTDIEIEEYEMKKDAKNFNL